MSGRPRPETGGAPQLILWGVGHLGRLYAGGALRAGYAVAPIRRATDPLPVLLAHPEGTPILCAVGESDLEAVVDQVPLERRDDLVFVQNELFPQQLAGWDAGEATLAVVWTLCKPKLPLIVSRPTAVSGRHAAAVAQWHQGLELACTVLEPQQIGIEAAAKYAFIIAINALGLRDARTVGEWLARDPELVRRVTRETIALGAAFLGDPATGTRIEEAVTAGLRGFADLPTRGRTAQRRVSGALAAAASRHVAMPVIAEILGE